MHTDGSFQRYKNTWKITFNTGEKDEKSRYVRASKRTIHGSQAQAYAALEQYIADYEHGNDPANQTILEMIRNAQLGIVNRLENSISTLVGLDEAMKTISESKRSRGKELDIIYLLLQYEAFGLFGNASLPDIAGYLGVKAPQTRKYMTSLRDKGICKKIGSYNPVTYALTQEFKEKCGIAIAPERNEAL